MAPVAPERESRIGHAERDIVTLGIATAAIILFVGTGSSVVAPVVRSLMGTGIGPDKMLLNAMLLNIALIIFGWRRYRQLRHEVEERRKAEAHARTLAETDPLTGCLNRRSLSAGAEALLSGSEGLAGSSVVAMMIDLDNFKQVNDFNGHSVGDHILIESARRIAALLPPGALVARLGGDEFACVVASDPRRPEIAENLAAQLIEELSAPILCNGAPVHVTASIGLARSGPNKSDAAELLHMADIAMYHAKKEGRNRSHWFETPMEDELRFRKELEDGIRRGIANREFVPFYEQQIDLETGRLTGFEMLARWQSPTLGHVSPEVFIPVSEDIGAIGELSECVIRQALEDAKGWDPSLTLAVNISPMQLRDPWFAQKLLKMLVTANFPPARLEIEITESCLHENIAIVRSLIASLKNQGIRVSLDDFAPATIRWRSCATCRSTGSRSTAPSSPTCRKAKAMPRSSMPSHCLARDWDCRSRWKASRAPKCLRCCASTATSRVRAISMASRNRPRRRARNSPVSICCAANSPNQPTGLPWLPRMLQPRRKAGADGRLAEPLDAATASA